MLHSPRNCALQSDLLATRHGSTLPPPPLCAVQSDTTLCLRSYPFHPYRPVCLQTLRIVLPKFHILGSIAASKLSHSTLTCIRILKPPLFYLSSVLLVSIKRGRHASARHAAHFSLASSFSVSHRRSSPLPFQIQWRPIRSYPKNLGLIFVARTINLFEYYKRNPCWCAVNVGMVSQRNTTLSCWSHLSTLCRICPLLVHQL